MTAFKNSYWVILILTSVWLFACGGGSDSTTPDGDSDNSGDIDGDFDAGGGENDADGDSSDSDGDLSETDGDLTDGDSSEGVEQSDSDAGVVLDKDRDGFTEEQGDCNDNNRSVYPGAPDIPDFDGIDQNCDGKDGNTSTDRYLSASSNSADFASTIAQCTAITGCHILVEQSYYQFSPPLNLIAGTRMYGGYTDDFSKRAIIDPALQVYTTTLASGNGEQNHTVTIEDQITTVLLDGFHILGPSYPFATTETYALWIKSSADVRIRHCLIEGGNAADGADGTHGRDGEDGGNADNVFGGEAGYPNDLSYINGGNGGYQTYWGEEDSWNMVQNSSSSVTCNYWNQKPKDGIDLCDDYWVPPLSYCDESVDDPGNCRSADDRDRSLLDLDGCQLKPINNDIQPSQICWCIHDPDSSYANDVGEDGVFLESQHGCDGQCGMGGEAVSVSSGSVNTEGFWVNDTNRGENGLGGSYGQGGAGGVAGGMYMCVAQNMWATWMTLAQPGGPGGGGGAGGWGGGGGQGGEHGAPAIAALIVDSTVDLSDITIKLGSGGNGGQGGDGGSGGTGGIGGGGWHACPVPGWGSIQHFSCGAADNDLVSNCNYDEEHNFWEDKWNGGKGAAGGNGGDAGSGGGGAGGNGGSAFGIGFANSTIHQHALEYTGGSAGAGGSGGNSGLSGSDKASCTASTENLTGENGANGSVIHEIDLSN